MMKGSSALQRLLERIDTANREDPTPDPLTGEAHEYIDAQRLTRWVLRLKPDASDELRIAARGQHIRRWKIPRETFPQGRTAYLRWRETLKKFHAGEVCRLMEAEGFSAESREKVKKLILKKDIGADPEAQALEDGLCLVFLENEFRQTREKIADDEKMSGIVKKTWAKMSDQARAEALKLDFDPDDLALIQKSIQ